MEDDRTALADPPAPPSGDAPRGRLFHPLVVAMAVSAGLVVIASTLPWAESVDGADRVSGAEGGGRITIPLAVLGAGLALFAGGRLWALIVNAVAGGVVFAIAAYELSDPSRLLDAPGTVTAAGGLWMTAAGGAAWTIASLLAIVRRRSVAASGSPR